jgi:hypothetical protein
VCSYVRYKLTTTEIGVQMDVGVSIVNEVAAVVSVFIISTISHDTFLMIEQQFYRVHSSSRHRPFDRKYTSKNKFPDNLLLSRNCFEGYEEALCLPV